ncbi:unnamed protein product [Didymodactylos carnosus]|uniref:Aminoglycoside phosphotransferase domain-containing protein n=1 Tax=Didymodactylos carnosus TaxID=1234261 RepID=A0A815CLP1_9BILA|nr:unnamed protein product [Didymodactylos carnosus]CAF4085219.1 unnamed protein product [Didymodactylos carnosus]
MIPKAIHGYLLKNMHLIDYEIISRLLHMDLHPGNILINFGCDQDCFPIICGLLDIEDALIGHNEYELMRIEKGSFEDAQDSDEYRTKFLSAYTKYVKLDDGYELRRPFYSLSRELVGMKCLLEYGLKYTQAESVEEHMKNIELKIRKTISDSE